MLGTKLKSALRATCVTLACLLAPLPTSACVGDECLQIWSTEAGGGALAIEFDFSAKVQTYRAFCTSNEEQCLFTALDPGFIATPEPKPASLFHAVADGTRVDLEIVDIAPSLTISIDGLRLTRAGDVASLGTFPEIHVHPSWQLLVPGNSSNDYLVSFRLLSDSPAYADSEIYTVTVTNAAPTPIPTSAVATPMATATATATATPKGGAVCIGDCDASGDVTVDEILTCVNAALGSGAGCAACDGDGDSVVTVDEIIGAVNAALTGCTIERPTTLAELQSSIFTPRCATPLCHDSGTAGGALVLVDGLSHGELVGVVPQSDIAAAAGKLLVDPGNPDNSFLVIKLIGPPLGAGGRMPLLGAFLSDEQVEAVRSWILSGAMP